MALANVALTDTFDTWRTRTNQIIVLSDGNETRSIAAFDKANTAGTDAINAYGTANDAFAKANTANTDAINAYGTANAAFTKANTAGTDAISAFGQANTARTHANSAYAAANAAFNAANTISLDPVYTGNIIATGPANTVVIKPSSSATVANTITISQNGQIVQGNATNVFSYVNDYWLGENRSPYIVQRVDTDGGDAGSAAGYYVMDETDKILTSFEVYSGTNQTTTYIGGNGESGTPSNKHTLNIRSNSNVNSSIRLTSGIANFGTLVVQNNKVSIGRTSDVDPGYKLDVNGSVNAAALLINGTPVSGAISLTTDDTTDGSYYITLSSANTGSVESVNVANALYFNPSTGTLSATIFNSTSDIKYKTNVATISNALDVVCQLRGVSFDWTATGNPSYGLIAQEVQQVIPEVVSTTPQGTLALNYDSLIGYLVEAIKELRTKVENNG